MILQKTLCHKLACISPSFDICRGKRQLPLGRVIPLLRYCSFKQGLQGQVMAIRHLLLTRLANDITTHMLEVVGRLRRCNLNMIEWHVTMLSRVLQQIWQLSFW